MKRILMVFIIFFICLPSISYSKVFHIPEKNLYIFAHPETPVNPGKKVKETDQDEPKDNDYYELLEFHIDSAMEFSLNEYIPIKFVSPILSSFSNWEQVVDDSIFTVPLFPNTNKSWYQNDGENVISFVKFTPRDYIAFAAIFYDPDTLAIVDADIVLNALHKWDVGSPRAFDVENIMTHEVGHIVGLNDLYLSIYSELTMYGYGEKGEVKKRTLENGDILGAQFLYGTPQ